MACNSPQTRQLVSRGLCGRKRFGSDIGGGKRGKEGEERGDNPLDVGERYPCTFSSDLFPVPMCHMLCSDVSFIFQAIPNVILTRKLFGSEHFVRWFCPCYSNVTFMIIGHNIDSFLLSFYVAFFDQDLIPHRYLYCSSCRSSFCRSEPI